MKKLLLILAVCCYSITAKATVHTIQVWDGYFQFLPSTLTIQLGDTIEWLPLDQPTMIHTITSSNIPAGAASFDELWQAPADTFFRYIPQVVGTYEYVCTPHVTMGMVASFTVEDSTVSILENTPQIEVYPNPTSDILYLKNYDAGTSLVLLDIEGSMVKPIFPEKGYIDLRNLPHGIYLLQIEQIGLDPKTLRVVITD